MTTKLQTDKMPLTDLPNDISDQYENARYLELEREYIKALHADLAKLRDVVDQTAPPPPPVNGDTVLAIEFRAESGAGRDYDPQNTGYTATYVGGGIYTVTHNLGHLNYVAQGFCTYGSDALVFGNGPQANKAVTTHNLQLNTLQVFTTAAGNGAPDLQVPFGIVIHDFGETP